MTSNRVTAPKPAVPGQRRRAMASAHGRLGQHFLAVLDVALRVPSIFIIDAILNSYSDPGTGWSGTAGRALIRALGESVRQSGIWVDRAGSDAKVLVLLFNSEIMSLNLRTGPGSRTQ